MISRKTNVVFFKKFKGFFVWNVHQKPTEPRTVLHSEHRFLNILFFSFLLNNYLHKEKKRTCKNLCNDTVLGSVLGNDKLR